MKTLAFSPKAAADVDEIYDYTEEQWGSAQAERYIAKLEQACSSLPLRSVRRINENRQGILIVRVLHQRMDHRRHL